MIPKFKENARCCDDSRAGSVHLFNEPLTIEYWTGIALSDSRTACFQECFFKSEPVVGNVLNVEPDCQLEKLTEEFYGHEK